MHSKAKRQPPKNESIKAPYKIEKLIKNAEKLELKGGNFKVAITPNENGNTPKVEITFTILGV